MHGNRASFSIWTPIIHSYRCNQFHLAELISSSCCRITIILCNRKHPVTTVTTVERNICVQVSQFEKSMSLASKITLGAAVTMSVGTISYVHYKQHLDRDRLHGGILRDVESQQRRKTQNLYLLQQQIELTKQLRKSEDEQLQNSESAG